MTRPEGVEAVQAVTPASPAREVDEQPSYQEASAYARGMIEPFKKFYYYNPRAVQVINRDTLTNENKKKAVIETAELLKRYNYWHMAMQEYDKNNSTQFVLEMDQVTKQNLPLLYNDGIYEGKGGELRLDPERLIRSLKAGKDPDKPLKDWRAQLFDTYHAWWSGAHSLLSNPSFQQLAAEEIKGFMFEEKT